MRQAKRNRPLGIAVSGDGVSGLDSAGDDLEKWSD